jgi:hypothetical protein
MIFFWNIYAYDDIIVELLHQNNEPQIANAI